MTPKQYASKFLDMEVYIFTQQPGTATPAWPQVGPGGFPMPDGTWVRTSVKSYRLGAASAPSSDPKPDPKNLHYYFGDLSQTVKGQKDIYTRIKRIDGTIESSGYDYKDISYALVAPFYGKGYPEEAQLALQMRYRYQKTSFSLADFVKASFIGLDCNGFVGGYLDRRNAPEKWLRTTASLTSTPIKSLLGPETKYFTSWADFKPPGVNCLILALCDDYGNVLDHTPDGGVGHIVITEPRTLQLLSPTGPVKVEAVESTAAGKGGLTCGIYTIETMKLDRAKRAYFLVDRGPGMGKKLWFRITEVT